MGDWKPDRLDIVDGSPAYFWVVPARVGGVWSVRIEGEPAFEVRIEQQYQRLDGDAGRGSTRVALQEPQVRGPAVAFRVPYGSGGVVRFDATADHRGRMSGTATLPDGQRKPFVAERS